MLKLFQLFNISRWTVLHLWIDGTLNPLNNMRINSLGTTTWQRTHWFTIFISTWISFGASRFISSMGRTIISCCSSIRLASSLWNFRILFWLSLTHNGFFMLIIHASVCTCTCIFLTQSYTFAIRITWTSRLSYIDHIENVNDVDLWNELELIQCCLQLLIVLNRTGIKVFLGRYVVFWLQFLFIMVNGFYLLIAEAKTCWLFDLILLHHITFEYLLATRNVDASCSACWETAWHWR